MADQTLDSLVDAKIAAAVSQAQAAEGQEVAALTARVGALERAAAPAPAASASTPAPAASAPTPAPPGAAPPAPAPAPVTTPPPAPAPTPQPAGVSVAPPPATALPVPALLTAFQDDRNAVLSWYCPGTVNGHGPAPDFVNGVPRAGCLRPDEGLPDPVAGFLVTWGPADNPALHAARTAYSEVMCQPLDPGVTYTAAVACVDLWGRAGAPSAPVTFAHDSSRVDAMRARCTGFFDDFNLPQGLPDERKWNVAYNPFSRPDMSGFFVNTQSHYHLAASNYCDAGAPGWTDRGWVQVRPRAVWDLTGLDSDLLEWDMDGAFLREQWYLDLVPADYNGGRLDTTGQTHLEDGVTRAFVPSFLRLHQETSDGGGKFRVTPIDGTGLELADIARTDFSPGADGKTFAPLGYLGLGLIPNVRRRFGLRRSRAAPGGPVTDLDLFCNGVHVLHCPVPAAYARDRVLPLHSVLNYNCVKSNAPQILWHGDNFGFGGPAPSAAGAPTVTHNYRAALDESGFVQMQAGQTLALAVKIPDPVAGAVAARLHFGLQSGQPFVYDPSFGVTVNGHDLPIPAPSANAALAVGLPDDRLVTPVAAFPYALDLPAGLVVTGVNTVTFRLDHCGPCNVHVELDFPAASAPAYTQPMAVLDPDCASGVCPPGESMPGMPAMVTGWGPTAVISDIADFLYTVGADGGVSRTQYWSDHLPSADVFAASRAKDWGHGPGLLPVTCAADGFIALLAGGSDPGVARLELLVDGAVARRVATDAQGPAPAARHTFLLDLAALPDGEHRLFARAYDAAGSGGRVGYWQALVTYIHEGRTDADYSFRVRVGP